MQFLDRARAVGLSLICLVLAPAALKASEPLRVIAYGSPKSAFFTPDMAGLEYEILRSFAGSRGRTLEVTWADTFEEVFRSIDAGEADVAASSVTITPNRQQRYSFSRSYFPVRIVLVESASERTAAFSALARTPVAVIPGSTHERFAERIPGIELVFGETTDDLFDLVRDGAARALISDTALALPRLVDYPSLAVTLFDSETQHLGFVLPYGSYLAHELSGYIDELRSSETYYLWVTKYLGPDAVDVVRAGYGR